MDIFKIFNCFNDVNQMKVCIDAVRATGKVAEMCVCYTSDITTSEIPTSFNTVKSQRNVQKLVLA